ncbi:LURP-one-related/scramblase family protein [Thermoactinospora rubra]|uniref:LURP-one-related/scramblase family protein n=1 Tax=Thermoactinospora rubra TaxID=1088767 RepID=UPI000A10CD8E|nr:LURP-one-related family protein [Thermoactinospora rubra]
MIGRRHQAPPPVTEVYQLQQRALSLGEDFWIENGLGQRVYRVDGKVFHFRKTFLLKDLAGQEMLRIQSRILRFRETMVIERGDERVATLHKRLISLRDRYVIDLGERGELHAKGNFVDHEYAISRDGTQIALVSKRWLRARDTYGVSIVQGEDAPLLLAIVVCIDAISHPRR